MINHINLGIVAHVDAGKTTLSEGLLYLSGVINRPGRVDHKDAFLDIYQIEKERGITIFSKQAQFNYTNLQVTLVDTPGHADFGAEMERALQVLDYAILTINGTDGIRGYTRTLWQLLDFYNIPTYIFVNKMDISDFTRKELMKTLTEKLDGRIVNFDDKENLYENIAVNDETALEKYLEISSLDAKDISDLIAERKIFPCFFGSALKMDGVGYLLDSIVNYSRSVVYENEFSAKVYKISRDEQNHRLTWMKITGGELHVKDEINGEKVNQIRIYSGGKYITSESVCAGCICAVTGLSQTYAGQVPGGKQKNDMMCMQPIFKYSVTADACSDLHGLYLKLKQLDEEDPSLKITWDNKSGEIFISLMGKIQMEVIKKLVYDRFNEKIDFGTGNVEYRETITDTVEGVGHFEPLKHYAEVHLKLEPLPRGAGVEVCSECSEDVLDKSYRKLIVNHLTQKEHAGVLTGSPVTDIKITLISGRAHIKHTESSDFNQAALRAVRQGLKSAQSVLLEPYCEFSLKVPTDALGRALNDIKAMYGEFDTPDIEDNMSLVCGSAPVSAIQGYEEDVISYTGGKGQLSTRFKGYDLCHNSEEVIERIGYDSESDTDNPTGSIFCSHGAGYSVSWDKVQDYMHLPNALPLAKSDTVRHSSELSGAVSSAISHEYDDRELREIFERTFGQIKSPLPAGSANMGHENNKYKEYRRIPAEKKDEYLLVDGYNIIFTDNELNNIAKDSLDCARGILMDILCNYQGFRQCTVILVFDAYKVRGNPGEVRKYNNIYVVYTKEAETADMYIEKAVHEMNRKYNVTVATSDGLEQLIIMGSGAKRISAREFMEEIKLVNKQIREEYLDKGGHTGNYVM